MTLEGFGNGIKAAFNQNADTAMETVGIIIKANEGYPGWIHANAKPPIVIV